ncbi:MULTISPECIES: MarR family transcriptional regulator [unclassified Paenibacillus]|uniref:MarR family winged helix-turn-helix transcriptional regulator n=1 Tax=unclassified Paenibacillus TaxID=185978 RepID=UPI00240768EE|nr:MULTISPECIES: MarR family transcriptional regulator [unclassified Paenibacillus]MDF9839973.1 MarR family 2-MHQ and catechol resistance regulon transcriptional repressor [Paenibacillus sp. PastF-2]MDF9846555.1 MarR family 2-MHQ and catechol resistance regulon transcriptional repressor [Paenibacillus sp. PastM-2]MDF9853097.1 MarR family 2-MHQ and catechol resistance regulon transcriptional repressor [Paenibacillus sp. PastF-1]MDH6478399.1 MarR family 2-MHQ and catechol resistance regulon trans
MSDYNELISKTTGSPDLDQAASLKLFVVLSKAYKSLMDHAVRDMKSHGLASAEFMVLEVLYHRTRIPLQQIGEKILVTSGSITYNIDKLEKRGLLKRVPCDEDRRVTYAEITEAGRELFDDIFPKHVASIHGLMGGLSEDEKKQTIELLKKLGKGV